MTYRDKYKTINSTFNPTIVMFDELGAWNNYIIQYCMQLFKQKYKA